MQFWPGIIKEKQSRFKNIAEAFKQIVRYANETDMDEVTIAEDDMQLTSHKSWQYYLAQKPNSFDLYFGGIYAGNVAVTETSKKLYQLKTFTSGLTLVTIQKHFYEHFLSTNCDERHLDNALGMEAYKREYFVTRPFVCKQITPTYSENHHKEVSDYSAYEMNWEYLT